MNRHRKKNKYQNIASGSGQPPARSDFKILKTLGLNELSNGRLAVILGFILICLGILASRYASPKSAGLLAYPGKVLISSLTGKPAPPAPLAGKFKPTRLPILLYHHVGEAPAGADQLRTDLTVPQSEFELQAAWLKGQGYESISLQNLLDFSRGKFQLPEKPVIFTFDDGYEDVFQNAVPILKKYGFTGSFGVITQFPGKSEGTNIYAAWQEIAAAKRQGMEIISHTQDHFDGTSAKYDSAFILRNLADSQQDLIKNLGGAEPILIYPYGHYNSNYIAQAKKAGFEMALTVNPGKTIYLDKLMELPRIRVGRGESIETFQKLILE